MSDGENDTRKTKIDSVTPPENNGESSNEECKESEPNVAVSPLSINKAEETPSEPFIDPSELLPGDHVYIWKSSFGIPFAYQRHGIILSTSPTITITDFYPDSKNSELPSVREISLSEFTSENKSKRSRIHKVKYSAKLMARLFQRSGTVTSTSRDHSTLVLARASFLLENTSVLPPYHPMSSNSECLSVFCSTGSFLTLQACSFLNITAITQAKSAVITGGIVAVSTTQVAVPAAGIWGMMGVTYTSAVPLAVTQPWLLPVLLAYGVTAILPLEMLRRWKNQWNVIEEELNKEFWEECDRDLVDEFWMEKNMNTVHQNFGERAKGWKEDNEILSDGKEDKTVIKLFD